MGNTFLSFSLFERDFFCLRKAFVPLLKFQMVFRDEGGKKKLSLWQWRVFSPEHPKGRRQNTAILSSKKQMLTLSRARSWLHQSGDYKEQHETYTNNHTHFHTCSVLTSPHLKFAAKLSVQFPACFFNISENISVQLVGLL